MLGSLSWPTATVESFLREHRAGHARLPAPPPPRFDLARERAALVSLRASLDVADPVEQFLDETAASYQAAATMLREAGTPRFFEISASLYGLPSDPLPGSSVTHLAAAGQLLAVTRALESEGWLGPPPELLAAEEAAAYMRARLVELFADGELDVVIDVDLASKAAAGSTRVRLRGGASFTKNELDQLVEHEAFVHSATACNGRAQPVLGSMGLGAPRTTLTQEGIATVAELVTHTLDIARLRRIALRIQAIARAIEGADFVETFRFFLERGQDDDEAARSAMRVFRGGDVRGRCVFTKDVVYLQGLVAVHTFLRKAISQHEPQHIERLFAGRLTLTDVITLGPAFDEGLVAPPRFVPGWARHIGRLSAYLAFAALSDVVDLGAVELDAILPASTL